jgi:multidrug efflux pump subunit AcrA (membrane-fusion protein)
MKKILNGRLTILRITGIIISILIIQSCGENKKENPTTDKTEYTDTISVEAENVQLRELNLSKTFSGTLEGEEQANIIAKIAERIMTIKARVGDYVKTGDVLFELDKSGAQSQFYQAQAVFSLNAQKDFERMKIYSMGGCIRQALIQAQTGYDVAKANLMQQKALLK